jgi:hypothetical protein
MGLQSSRVNRDYYDRLFGYRYGRPLEEIAQNDFKKLIYKPDPLLASRQLLQAQPIITTQNYYQKKLKTNFGTEHPKQGLTYLYYRKPDIVHYSVPVNQPVTAMSKQLTNLRKPKIRPNTAYFRPTRIAPNIEPRITRIQPVQ